MQHLPYRFSAADKTITLSLGNSRGDKLKQATQRNIGAASPSPNLRCAALIAIAL